MRTMGSDRQWRLSPWHLRQQAPKILAVFIALQAVCTFWIFSPLYDASSLFQQTLSTGVVVSNQSFAIDALPSTQVHDEQQNFLPKVLVIYFPQFHPDPLNDKLWGLNFSDWNNLRAAPERNRLGFQIPRPLPFRPDTPSHLLGLGKNGNGLGYYDLRSKQIRQHHSDLARLYGIDGFIYHHYWFYDPSHPGPNLHAPLMEMLKDGHPNIPFFLNWCSVNWVNVWMGRPIFQPKDAPINKNKALMLQQQYFNASHAQIKEHYTWLRQFFHHENYIKVRGEPVFFSYQWNQEMVPILEYLRQLAIEDGFPNLYLIVGRGGPPSHIHDTSGLDDGIIKQMQRKIQPIDMFPMELFNQTMVYPYAADYIHKPLALPRWCRADDTNGLDSKHKIPSYPEPRNKPEINGITLTFDNTPRRDFKVSNLWNIGNASSVVARFRDSLKAALTFDTCCWHPSHRTLHNEERFVVINAWNEWGEGMTMEPSDVYGNKFLEAVKEAKEEVSSLQTRIGGLTKDGMCVLKDDSDNDWNFMGIPSQESTT